MIWLSMIRQFRSCSRVVDECVGKAISFVFRQQSPLCRCCISSRGTVRAVVDHYNDGKRDAQMVAN